jgi:hypothetical protein
MSLLLITINNLIVIVSTFLLLPNAGYTYNFWGIYVIVITPRYTALKLYVYAYTVCEPQSGQKPVATIFLHFGQNLSPTA